MIRCQRTAAGTLVTGDLPAGAAAYLDADWLPEESEGEIPALVAHADGVLAWRDSPPAQLRAVVPAVEAVASAWLRLARDASRAVEESARDACEVAGQGLIAEWVRRLIDAPAANGHGGAPRAIVDTRGGAEALAEATRKLADLGTLVLAGEAGGESATLDLYPDVHVRGLRIVGVAPLMTGPVESGAADRPFIEGFPDRVTDARLGSVLPLGGACYRVSA